MILSETMQTRRNKMASVGKPKTIKIRQRFSRASNSARDKSSTLLQVLNS